MTGRRRRFGWQDGRASTGRKRRTVGAGGAPCAMRDPPRPPRQLVAAFARRADGREALDLWPPTQRQLKSYNLADFGQLPQCAIGPNVSLMATRDTGPDADPRTDPHAGSEPARNEAATGRRRHRPYAPRLRTRTAPTPELPF
ncbi:hypothetical protein PUN4_960030 [Paraburkholderia unamae]|nr:hypothetical protein PUN4_960030 [Paraburkholderia unamae]